MSAQASPPRLAVSVLFVLALPAFAQEEAALFDAPLVLIEDIESAPFQRLLDFDGDGFDDAVGTAIRDDGNGLKVMAWRNDGKGGFALVWDELTIPAISHDGDEPLHLEVGDFDGDGFDDFVFGGQGGYHVYTSLGDGTFTSVKRLVTPDVVDLAVGDFDGDGRDDVALLKTSFGLPSHLQIDFGGTGVGFEVIVPAVFADTLLALEGDGDGTDDLLVAKAHTARVYLVTSTTITAGPALTAVPASKHMWTAGDVDGDGDDDVVCFNIPAPTPPLAPHYDVFLRTAPGAWTAQGNAFGGPAEYLADVDGDGDLDGVCCGGGGTDPSFPTLNFESTFEIAINGGGASFAPSFQFPGLGSRSLAGAADLDHDGDVDLVAGRCVLYARGPLTETPMPSMVFNPFIAREDGIGDMDADGDPEFRSTAGPWNLGDGTFGFDPNQPPFPSAPAGTSLTGPAFFGDFTGDGAADWVYTLYDTSSGIPAFLRHELVKNTGGGGFVLAGPAAPPGVDFKAQDFTVDNHFSADGDGDGDVDLFVRVPNGFGATSTTFRENDGTGTFTATDTLVSCYGKLVADLNGDGIPDALSTRFGQTAGLWVHVGTGLGAFPHWEPKIQIAPGVAIDPTGREIHVADLDDDGRLDLSFVDADDRPVLLLNTTAAPGGTPTFAVAELFSAYQTDPKERGKVVGLDANGDGRTDVLFGPLALHPRSSYVFLRKPGAAAVPTLDDYEAPILQILPRLFARDVDGDGDVDLLGEYVARNATHHFASGGGRRVQSEAPHPGAGGMVPILGATGPFRAGETLELRLTGGVGGGLSLLLVSPHAALFADVPLPGLTLYVDPFQPGFLQIPVPLQGAPGAPGEGTWGSAVSGFVLPAEIAGLSFQHQAFVLDPWAGQISHSNRLTLTYGP